MRALPAESMHLVIKRLISLGLRLFLILVDPGRRVGFVTSIYLYIQLLCPAVSPHRAVLRNLRLRNGVRRALQCLRQCDEAVITILK